VGTSAGLHALVEADAPLWAGEAEIFRTYWDSPRRTRASDLAWIARQAHKELFDGVVPRVTDVESRIGRMEADVSRGEMAVVLREASEELDHYCAFADLYDALRSSAEPPLTFASVRDDWAWQENADLAVLRRRHRDQHGPIGARACALTEGGYGTIFVEAMALRGRGGVDDLIADTCAAIYQEELKHMEEGLAGLDESDLTSDEWTLLTELTVEQLRARIAMRNVQFGCVLSPERVREIQAGAVGPIPLDYGRACLSAESSASDLRNSARASP
jgi:hypothetical protein